jgi:hypothetical protein
MHQLKVASHKSERMCFATSITTEELIRKLAAHYGMTESEYIDMVMRESFFSQDDLHDLPIPSMIRRLEARARQAYGDGKLTPKERDELLIITNEIERKALERPA